MNRVHPKGSKCSSGSLPTQPPVSQDSNAAASIPDMLQIGKRHNQQGKEQGGAPKPFTETKPIGIPINPKLGKQEEG